MISLTIILIAAGVVIAALASIVYRTIRENSRLKLKLGEAVAGDKALTPLVSKLKQELVNAQARDADLFEALEKTRLLYNKLLRENRELETDRRERLSLSIAYDKLLREHGELEARNTALVEAMEARPTQPKRTVRKNSTAGEQP